jgi:predicted RNase H-like nuclease
VTRFLCCACGTEHADSGEAPPPLCAICQDDRQYVPEGGQRWTTLDDLRRKHRTSLRELEPHLTGIGVEPSFAIGQRALLVESADGNVLWDCVPLLEEMATFVESRGGLSAIAISHPHYYTTMVEWAHAFDCPVLVHETDREWVMRPDPAVEQWAGDVRELSDELTLLRLGGHFEGGQVLHWRTGADGSGALLSGDIVQVLPGRRRVSFMYSYPMLIPLPADEVERMAAALDGYEFERIYGAWWDRVVDTNGKDVVRRSAERYVRAVTTEPAEALPVHQEGAVRVAGVDMAGGGWAVVVLEGSCVADAFRCDTFAEALLVDAEVIAVDIPIGIPELEPRPADAEARRFVGPRASSVFTTPIRPVLEAETYARAREVATALTGKSLSAQAYALRRRILEVDEYARGDGRVIEVHPEVSFRELARRPIPSKHRAEGLVERRRLLVGAGIDLPKAVPRIAEPDLLDATVAAWTARRYARGEAAPMPVDHRERIGAIWR